MLFVLPRLLRAVRDVYRLDDEHELRRQYLTALLLTALSSALYWSHEDGLRDAAIGQVVWFLLNLGLGWRVLRRGRVSHVLLSGLALLAVVTDAVEPFLRDSALRQQIGTRSSVLQWLGMLLADLFLTALVLSPAVRRHVWARRPEPTAWPPAHGWGAPAWPAQPPVQQSAVPWPGGPAQPATAPWPVAAQVQAAPPQWSTDGRWWWDGTRWVAAAAYA